MKHVPDYALQVPTRRIKNTLPTGQKRARLAVCQRVVDRGGSLSDAALELGMENVSALWRWLNVNDPDTLKKLADVGKAKRVNRTSDDQKIHRLKMLLTMSNSEVARRLGIHRTSVNEWASKHAPDGPAAALEKLRHKL